MPVSSKALIIPAAGSGQRMQRETAKPFIKLHNRPILAHTLSSFLPLDGLTHVLVATSVDYMEEARHILRNQLGDRISWECVLGGDERQQSVFKALMKVSEIDLTLVHDAVRPFVTLQQIQRCCMEAEETGAAILGIPSKDTLKKVDAHQMVQETPERKFMWQVQTPQVFRTELLKKAHASAADQDYIGTDDASLVERLGEPVKIVRGSSRNIKITFPQDLKWADFLLKQNEGRE